MRQKKKNSYHYLLNYFRVNCYCGYTKKEQFIAGGGEDEDETIIISAKREAYEEANIGMDCKYSVLDTQNSIPTYCFKEARKIQAENQGYWQIVNDEESNKPTGIILCTDKDSVVANMLQKDWQVIFCIKIYLLYYQ